jgi:chromosome segregation ATPase
MPRASIYLASLFLGTAASFAQTASPDTQLTQALLAEIHQLRLDLQTTAVTIQRVQIVMYRLQAATTLMTRATQRMDDARSKCTQAQSQRKGLAAELERIEEKRRNAQDPDRKGLEDVLPHVKANLEMWTNEEQQCQTRQADAENEFRTQQAKINDLQDQLDRLDRVLDSYGKK